MALDTLIVIDMQKDFIDGALGSAQAAAILPRVEEKLRGFGGRVIFTRDCHTEKYLDSQEGRSLPIPHCIEGSDGWQLSPALEKYAGTVFDKHGFGSLGLAAYVKELYDGDGEGSITLVGLCTDICVITAALMLKAAVPEVPVIVDAACCAGVTPESHAAALAAMKPCQIIVINEA